MLIPKITSINIMTTKTKFYVFLLLTLVISFLDAEEEYHGLDLDGHRPAYRSKKHKAGEYPCFSSTHPFHVAIAKSIGGNKVEFVCGGTLIRTEWVLTTALCLKGNDEFKVYFAMNRRSKHVTYLKKFLHQKSEKRKNNVGLLQLSRHLNKEEDYIDIVELPCGGDHGDPICDKGLITGFKGNMYQMWCADVLLVSRQKCLKTYKKLDSRKVANKTLCTVYSKGEIKLCSGDEGSPLMCGNLQVGIIAHTGNAYCSHLKDIPDSYMSLELYLDWINNTISTHSRDPEPEGRSTYYKGRGSILNAGNFITIIFIILFDIVMTN